MTLDEFTEIHNIFQKGIFEVSAQRKFLACPESENFAFDSYKEKKIKRQVSSVKCRMCNLRKKVLSLRKNIKEKILYSVRFLYLWREKMKGTILDYF